MKHKKITPVPVERDENGYWVHPALLDWFANYCISEGGFESWAETKGQEALFIYLEEDAGVDSRALTRWFCTGYEDISEWDPPMPDGEGWFIVSIHDTGDGPVCVWLREAQ